MRVITVHDQSWSLDKEGEVVDCTNPFDASDPVTAASVSYTWAS
jgi:hypothetical protein